MKKTTIAATTAALLTFGISNGAVAEELQDSKRKIFVGPRNTTPIWIDQNQTPIDMLKAIKAGGLAIAEFVLVNNPVTRIPVLGFKYANNKISGKSFTINSIATVSTPFSVALGAYNVASDLQKPDTKTSRIGLLFKDSSRENREMIEASSDILLKYSAEKGLGRSIAENTAFFVARTGMNIAGITPESIKDKVVINPDMTEGFVNSLTDEDLRRSFSNPIISASPAFVKVSSTDKIGAVYTRKIQAQDLKEMLPVENEIDLGQHYIMDILTTRDGKTFEGARLISSVDHLSIYESGNYQFNSIDEAFDFFREDTKKLAKSELGKTLNRNIAIDSTEEILPATSYDRPTPFENNNLYGYSYAGAGEIVFSRYTQQQGLIRTEVFLISNGFDNSRFNKNMVEFDLNGQLRDSQRTTISTHGVLESPDMDSALNEIFEVTEIYRLGKVKGSISSLTGEKDAGAIELKNLLN